VYLARRDRAPHVPASRLAGHAWELGKAASPGDHRAMQCPKCGAENRTADNVKCVNCGEGLSLGDSAMMRAILPVGRSGWAIASGYLALIMVTAPLAVITGILAIRDIRRNPHKHGMGRAIFGIVFGGLVTAFYVFILVVTASAKKH
jgi:hypothetical protein